MIACKDRNAPSLQRLLQSIEIQNFPKDQIETLIITEGTSESAKAIGIKRSKGKVVGILASDNELMSTSALLILYSFALMAGAAYSGWYHYERSDDVLNRYFSLTGGNDALSLFLGKNDHMPYPMTDKMIWPRGKSLGDNGYFVKRELIMDTDLDHYYHVDNANEVKAETFVSKNAFIWHHTGGNIFKFFKKRFNYGVQHAFNKDRRWHLIQKKEWYKAVYFVIYSLTMVGPLCLSIKGYRKVKDFAWFLHPIICLMTAFTYGLVMLNLGISRMFRSLFRPLAGAV